MLACKSFCSAGSATLTTVPSINAMLEAITVAARIHGAADGAQGDAAGAARMTPASQGGCGNAVTVNPFEPYPSNLHRLALLRHGDFRRRSLHRRMAVPGDPHGYLARLTWEAILSSLRKFEKSRDVCPHRRPRSAAASARAERAPHRRRSRRENDRARALRHPPHHRLAFADAEAHQVP